MPKKYAIRIEIFIFSLVFYLTVDFMVVFNDLFHAGSTLVANVSRENQGYQIAPKRNNSLKTFPYRT